jgi:hypothetical protein
VIHTLPNAKTSVFDPLFGLDTWDGVSLQIREGDVFDETLKWVEKSASSGRKWVVANDEQGPWQVGILPDDLDPTHDDVRKDVLWGNIMAGGGGVEVSFLRGLDW